jgi:hypothetical protein
VCPTYCALVKKLKCDFCFKIFCNFRTAGYSLSSLQNGSSKTELLSYLIVLFTAALRAAICLYFKLTVTSRYLYHTGARVSLLPPIHSLIGPKLGGSPFFRQRHCFSGFQTIFHLATFFLVVFTRRSTRMSSLGAPPCPCMTCMLLCIKIFIFFLYEHINLRKK